MITEKLIESLSKRLQVTNHLEETPDTVYLVTNISLGNKQLFSHSLDMNPLLTYLEKKYPSIQTTKEDK